jgi:methylmalonyl-CoA/ethylmalonyl-CoA epimerase
MIDGARFHHMGVACADLDTEERAFRALGYAPEAGADFVDPAQGVRGRFLVGGGPRLELLVPLDARSPLRPWLDRGTKVYHSAYEVPDLAVAVAGLVAARGRIVRAPTPAVAFSGREVCFVVLPNLMLVELIQAARAP